MRDGFHVENVIFEVHELVETELRQRVQSDFAFTIDLGFEPVQAAVPGDFNQFSHENFRDVTTTVFRMREQRDHADVTFPAAKALVERGFADDFLSVQGEQRQIAVVVGLLAPLPDDRAVENGLLDEEPLFLRHGEKKLLQLRLVAFAERADGDVGAVTQFKRERKFFEDATGQAWETFGLKFGGHAFAGNEMVGRG